MAQQEMIFSDYLRVLIKHKWTVLTVAILVTIFTYFWSARQEPLFKSTARIRIQRIQTFAGLFDELLVSSGDPIENYIYEIPSHKVIERAITISAVDISELSGKIKAERIQNTDLIDITVDGKNTEKAKYNCQSIVDAFIQIHDEMITANARDEYDNIQKSLNTAVDNFVSQDAEFRQKLGSKELTESRYNQGELLIKKLTEAQIALETLRENGNFTEDYPEIISFKNTINAIETKLKDFPATELESKSILQEYEQKRKVLDDMVGYLTKRLEEAKIAKTRKSERISIVEPPGMGNPVKTGTGYLTAAGLLLGLMLGIILAFIAENLDTSIRTLVEIEQTFHLPILGVIPHFSPHDKEIPIRPESFRDRIKYSDLVNSAIILWKAIQSSIQPHSKQLSQESPKSSGIIVPFSPRAPATEGYRSIRTNIQLAAGEDKIGAILVTSAGPAEGKSTTIINLAFAFAQAGKKTLIVGANMRRPSMYKTMGLKREIGLSEILTGDISWREALKDHRDLALGDKADENLATAPGTENLFFITCGGRTLQPSEWLSLPIFEATVRELETEFDVILIDGTPILPVPDSVIMSAAIGRVVLVYQSGVTHRDSMLRAISLIQKTGAKILGIVLNDLRATWGASPDYFHYRGYYGRPETK